MKSQFTIVFFLFKDRPLCISHQLHLLYKQTPHSPLQFAYIITTSLFRTTPLTTFLSHSFDDQPPSYFRDQHDTDTELEGEDEGYH